MKPLNFTEGHELSLHLVSGSFVKKLEPFSWSASEIGIQYECRHEGGEDGQVFVPWTQVRLAVSRDVT